MEAIKNVTDKITGKGDEQSASVTNSAAVRLLLTSRPIGLADM